MTSHYYWTVFWPSQLQTQLYQSLAIAQADIENSQVLISNDRPPGINSKLLLDKPHLNTSLLLKIEPKFDFSNSKYRHKIQDELCYLADQYYFETSTKLNLLFLPKFSPGNIYDFNKYLMDILFFFKERFAHKFRTIAVSIEMPNYSLVEHINLLKLGQNEHMCMLAYTPLQFEKMGVDSLKTSFIWRPYVSTIYLSDVDFDGKTYVSPGEGMIPNQSVCQIALEKKQEISFIFRPNAEMFASLKDALIYLKKCEFFMSKLD